MQTDARLTWYPGTILPYASLWHTVLRVISMNALSSVELPDGPHRALGSSSGIHRTVHLLHNDGIPVDTDVLARWLGESPEVFRWAHLGFMPTWSRFLFTPGLRICRQCAAAGYHSALLSLRLLNRCPIHGTPLHQLCRCGRYFSESLTAFGYRHAGSCVCGQLAFFTRETCRQPTIDPAVTHAFEPVVQWLERVAQLIRPKVTPIGWQRPWDHAWLTLLPQWGRALGFGYPSFFIQPPEVHRRVLSVSESGRFLNSGNGAPLSGPQRRKLQSPDSRSDRTSTASYWSTGPGTWVYRSMARYLRRHVVRESDRWVAEFQGSGNPLHIAQLLRSGRHALSSYADMLWSRRIESGIEDRRWPYRKVSTPPTKPIPAANLLHERIGLTPGPGREPAKPLSAASRSWMEYQIAGTTLLALWHDAMVKAATAASTGLARWEEDTDDTDLCDWVAIRQPDAGLRFLTLSIERRWLQALPRTEKSQRQRRAQQDQERRRRTLQDACRGACLTWTPREGWSVVESYEPNTPTACQRHRLLGIQSVRPLFWIFTSGELFVARLSAYRLQATAQTPKEAIEALRQCVRQYARTYGTQHLGDVRKPIPPVVSLKKVDELAELEHRLAVEKARNDMGFWRCASTVDMITRQYLSRRRVQNYPHE